MFSWAWGGKKSNATEPNTARTTQATTTGDSGREVESDDDGENLFASLSESEKKALVVLLCHCAGPELRRSAVVHGAVLEVANSCLREFQDEFQEWEHRGTRENIELVLTLPAGMVVGPRKAAGTGQERLFVTQVTADGGADAAGLVVGDVVESVGGQNFATPTLAAAHLRESVLKEGRSTLQLTVSRERTSMPDEVPQHRTHCNYTISALLLFCKCTTTALHCT